MNNPVVQVLLVEGKQDDYLLIRGLLGDNAFTQFDLEWAGTCEAARELLVRNHYDVCLFDNRLCEQVGLDLVREFAQSQTPFILLTDTEEAKADVAASQAGAADYLVKNSINASHLGRSIRYAIERKKTEQQLRTHSHLFNAIGQALVITDGVGNITHWNDFARSLYGWSSSEVMGRNILDVTPTFASQQQAAEILASLAAGESWSGEFHVQRRDGSTFLAHVTNTSVLDVGGKVVSIIGLSLDITQRKQSEEKLRDSEERYRAFIAASSEAIWRFELEQPIPLSLSEDEQLAALYQYAYLAECNEAMAQMYGFNSPQEITGKRLGELVVPSDPANIQYLRELIRSGYRLRDAESCEPDIQGQTKYFLNNLLGIIENGAVQRGWGTQRDITQRKQTEQELEVKGQEIVTIWESMTDAFFSLDSQWRLTNVNSQAASLMHKNVEEVIGKTLWELFAGAVDLKFYSEFHRAVEERVPVNFEEFFPPYNAWYDVHAYPSAVGLSVYFRDITRRKNAENALRTSEERFRAFMDHTPARVFMKDRQGRYVYLNRAVEQFRQAPASQLLGETIYDHFPPQIAEQLRQNDLQVLATGRAQQFEEIITSLDGRLHHEVVVKFLLPSGDGEQLLAGVGVDVTEQKQAEYERDRFFTLSLDMLAIIGSDGYMKRLNPAFEATLGFSNAEMMAVPFLQFVHPDDHAATLAEMARLANGEQVTRFENRYRCRDGSYKWLQWMSAPLEELWYCVAHDITGVKQAQADLEKANDQLEARVEERTAQLKQSIENLRVENIEHQMTMGALRETAESLEKATRVANAANRAKSDFLSRMSHELRTPLNAILGFGQILEMRDTTPAEREPIQQILKAGRHLLSLINEVLEISRIEAGHLSLSPEPIAADRIVAETLDLVRPLAGARQIRLTNEVSNEQAVHWVNADQQRLKQVLLNLLSNAVKYNLENGEVVISCQIVQGVETTQSAAAELGVANNGVSDNAQAESRLRFSIRDTGPGLNAEDISRLFVPFERLGAARTQIEGTGIGLTLCKRLVEAMDGRIGVQSELGQGSTFWFELPLTLSPLQHVELQGADTTIQSLPQRPRCTILYIEDNLSNIDLIEHVLADGDPDIRLLTAMQGSVGLELAAQHAPQLILLDVHLPDITGDVVLKDLKSNPATRDIPVVVLSADATASQIERLLSEGAAAYLTKPLDLKLFFSVLEQYLQRN